MARDKLAEIAARRSRAQRGGWWRGKSELDALMEQWRGGSGSLQIPPQFAAIRLVTILEVFTRDWVAEIIDSGDPYTGRGAELVKGSLKIDYAMAQALVGKQVTFGELVSHEISVNNIGDIEHVFSTLLATSLFASIQGVTDRWAIRPEECPAEPILADPKWARTQIARLFDARHIIVHELPDDGHSQIDSISDFVLATNQFVEATDQFFDTLIHGDYPVTQLGLNQAAAARVEKADTELSAILGQLDPDGLDKALIAAQAAWEDYRQKQAEYRASFFSGGSIAPMLFADEQERITRDRIERLLWFLERDEGDM